MEKQSNEITYLDIKNYWLKLFPELDSMNELDTILSDFSNIDSNSIEDFINNYKRSSSIDINTLFSKNTSNILENISNDIKLEQPFFNFFKPLFNFFIDEFYESLNTLSLIEDINLFIKDFLVNECTRLLEFSQRTLVLEINLARLSGKLKGSSKEERFEYYINNLLNAESYLKTLYSDYSHMYNILITRCMWDFKFLVEVVMHTKENLLDIKNYLLNTNEDIKISIINSSLGDSHNKGKTVSIVYFNNNKKIIYKPRSLDLEKGFNKFLSYLDEIDTNTSTPLYKMKVISKENYGFSEFIEPKDCNTENDVKNFYYKTGKLLGALFALNAKDIHHENIIAMSDNPIVIDLEALFHSDVTLIDKRFFKSIEVAQKIIDSSVYSIGFLPQKISSPYDNNDETYVDISGFGGEDNQVAPFKALSIVNGYTDEIKIEKVEGFIQPQNNNPKLNGKVAKSENYVNEIKDGFSHIYDILYKNKNEVIPLIQSIFSEMKNRFILRPTYIYGQLINTSYHPDFMQDEIHRYVLLHRLAVNVEKDFSKVVTSEIQDILQGDIPYFYSNINSNTIKNSKGEDINIILDQSPLDKVKEKLKNLSIRDKEMQLHFIDMSFWAKTTNSNKDETNIVFSQNTSNTTLNPVKLKELAIKIGDYLIEKSILGYSEGKLDRTWISTILIGRDECTWSLAPVGNSLYDGNSGIALFLAYLGKVTGEKRFINAANDAISSVLYEIDILDNKYPFLIGAYNGISGYFYSIYCIFKITKDKKLITFLKDKITLLYNLIPRDKNIDVISGAAGTIGTLLYIYNDINDEDFKKTLLDLCIVCFNHIKKSIVNFPNNSIAWGEGGVYVPCTGFAHGNAGIIAYLIKLYKIIKEPEILDIISKALNFERNLYSSKHKNWYSSEENKLISFAWCHGAPGILLSRLILKENGYTDSYIDEEIKLALETTIKQGFGNNPCFCHGDIGNLSILEYASKILNDEYLRNKCKHTYNSMFETVLKTRWNKGVFSGTESMGIMTGLSSFGYSLLREINDELVPEILWF